MDTEDEILKGAKLITNTEKQRLNRVEVRLSKIQCYKYETKSTTKIIKKI